MKINWTVRLKNKMFWVTIIPTALLLLSQILKLFGIDFDYSILSEQLVTIVGTIFTILAALGVVVDNTTSGLSDSTRALSYTEPYKEIGSIEDEEKQ